MIKKVNTEILSEEARELLLHIMAEKINQLLPDEEKYDWDDPIVTATFLTGRLKK